MITTREAAQHLGLDIKRATVAVQGFGNVGSVSAQLLARLGAKIVAVTDWKGGVHNPAGLDVDALVAWTAQHKTVAGFPKADALAADRIFELDVDVLIPAALEEQITMANAPKIKAKIIAEGANGPTTQDAHKHLHERGVFVIPDILANAGGVTTSYFEWVQDRLRLLLGRGRSEHAARAQDAHRVPHRARHGAEVQGRHADRSLHRRDRTRGDGDEAARHVRLGESS